MKTGSVLWFNNFKGFGFIRPDDGSKEVFVHYTAIEGSGLRTLKDDDKVSFDVIETDRGPQADNVKVIK